MAKKYVPSGYQILDLGTLTGNETVPVSEDSKLLFTLCDKWLKGGEIKKPLLISYFDSDESIRRLVTPVIRVDGSNGELRIILDVYVDPDNSVIKDFHLMYDGNTILYQSNTIEISQGE